MPLTLYFHPLSQPSRAVITLLNLTETKFEPKLTFTSKKETRTPEFLEMNPLGQIPAINDDGFTLGESDAIMKYIINSRKVGEAYYPEDPKKRAAVDRYLAFHHGNTRPHMFDYCAALYVDIIGIPVTVEETKPKAEATCKQLEEVFLKNTRYVGGDEITIADFLAVNELTTMYYASDFDFSQYPKLKAYIERCLENPVIAEVNKPVKGLPDFVKAFRAQKKQE